MSPLEITLIIIGIIVIIISCVMVDQSQKEKKQLTAGKLDIPLKESITEEERKQLLDMMKDMLSEASENTIVHTDDILSKISNEKIVAVNEFSDQIIEKIKRNHEEVVFLYNMLNDKEKELKSVVREIDLSKKKVQEIMESKAEHDRLKAAQKTKSRQTAKPAAPVEQKAVHPAEASREVTAVSGNNLNSNAQILELYSQGRSILEISRLLGLGQGEVKLVIDLYKGKK